jgi:hypothetical protein
VGGQLQPGCLWYVGEVKSSNEGGEVDGGSGITFDTGDTEEVWQPSTIWECLYGCLICFKALSQFAVPLMQRSFAVASNWAQDNGKALTCREEVFNFKARAIDLCFAVHGEVGHELVQNGNSSLR